MGMEKGPITVNLSFASLFLLGLFLPPPTLPPPHKSLGKCMALDLVILSTNTIHVIVLFEFFKFCWNVAIFSSVWSLKLQVMLNYPKWNLCYLSFFLSLIQQSVECPLHIRHYIRSLNKKKRWLRHKAHQASQDRKAHKQIVQGYGEIL